MKSGKIILMVFIVLASAISVATFHELGSNETTQFQPIIFLFKKKQ